jgi:hypothetical protein
MQKMPAPLRFIAPMECLEVDRIPEGDFWQYTYENVWQRVRESNPCTSLERAVS